MENPYEAHVEMAHTADGFMVISRIEDVRVQMEESQEELDRLRQDPSIYQREIELLEKCQRINLNLLELMESAEQEFYTEFDKLQGQCSDE